MVAGDVIYNSEYAMDPPDFVFGPDDEDFVPCRCSAIAPDDDQISSLEKALSEWDHEDSTRLLVIIQGLRFFPLKLLSPLFVLEFVPFLRFVLD